MGINMKKHLLGLLIVVLLALLATQIVYEHGYGYDWRGCFRPATLDWRTPYRHPGNYNPPWMYLILHPLALLPEKAGLAVLLTLSLGAVFACVGDPLKALICAAGAPVIIVMLEGQVDGLLLWGLLLPPAIGVPLALTKPQGLFLAASRRLSRGVVVALVIVVIGSLIAWGWWPGEMLLGEVSGRRTFLPWGILPGAVLAVTGYQKRSDGLLCLASLCLSPYWSPASLLPAMAFLAKDLEWWHCILLSVASWVFVLAVR